MTKIVIDEAVVRQALECLDGVWRGDYNGSAEEAITALRQALADAALDKMAENARELGLDYAPAQWGVHQQLALNKMLEQPAPPECKTEAEKTAFAFGWFKALESMREQPAHHTEQHLEMVEQADKFCDANCVWSDHHPDCVRAEQPAPAQPLTEWIDPNDKTQKRYLPSIGAPVLFCHGGKTYYGRHTGGSFQCGAGATSRHFNTWECRWMPIPAAHGITGEKNG